MRVAVVGSGLQGLCVALEFARRGADVHVFDRDAEPMARASRHNEGKIHLGFVYANEPSLATARRMARAAVRFAPLLRRLGVDLGGVARSEPFVYAVHRRSLLPPDALAPRYAAIAREVARRAAAPGADYFGVPAPQHVRRLPDREWKRVYAEGHVTGAFETAEIAIDPHRLAEAVAARVRRHPRVTLRVSTAVVGAEVGPDCVGLVPAGGPAERFDHLVNCGWCGRLALDAAAGLPPPPAWSFRRKYFVRLPPATSTAHITPTTVVLGGFGDVVRYACGVTYLSWYPAGCLGLEAGLTPAAEPTALDRDGMKAATLLGVAGVVPAVGRIDSGTLAAAELGQGVIYALGRTDVDDPSSRLHGRGGGARGVGRYHTVDTGKLTTAPLIARRLVAAVLPGRRVSA